MESKALKSRGLHVEERGPADGPPTLLLHGFTGTADAWGETILAGLARHVRVLAVDLPGHGHSSPGGTEPETYRVPRIVDVLLQLLDDRGIESADWVGYSMGGRIALAAAATAPGRTRRLVLESASPGLETEGERRERRRRDEALARRIETRGMAWFVDHWMALPLFATQRRLPPAVLAEARQRRLQHDPERLAAVLRGGGTGAQPSYWSALAGVEAPTLILTGGLDRKYVRLARRMQAALPSGLHRSIPDVGHTVHLEAPERWLDEVAAFLPR
jgi:2-succinyl-6-hydroxy-2,4-cyclohexadiene-1-carboxylate synthase